MIDVKSTDLVPKENTALPTIRQDNEWLDELDVIKDMICKDATPVEFKAFVAYAKMIKANPIKREIYFTKFAKKRDGKYKRDQNGNIIYDISMPVARDHYRKIALNHPDYVGHVFDLVYDGDSYIKKNGVLVSHEVTKFGEARGTVVGGYCLVERRGHKAYLFEADRRDSWDKGQSMWVSHPLHMFLKVIEANGLRGAFSDELGGVYSEDEMIPSGYTVTKQGNLHSAGAAIELPKATEEAPPAKKTTKKTVIVKEPDPEPKPKRVIRTLEQRAQDVDEVTGPEKVIISKEPSQSDLEQWARSIGMPPVSLTAMLNHHKGDIKLTVATIKKNYAGASNPPWED